jgi:hypothetical protein
VSRPDATGETLWDLLALNAGLRSTWERSRSEADRLGMRASWEIHITCPGYRQPLPPRAGPLGHGSQPRHRRRGEPPRLPGCLSGLRVAGREQPPAPPRGRECGGRGRPGPHPPRLAALARRRPPAPQRRRGDLPARHRRLAPQVGAAPATRMARHRRPRPHPQNRPWHPPRPWPGARRGIRHCRPIGADRGPGRADRPVRVTAAHAAAPAKNDHRAVTTNVTVAAAPTCATTVAYPGRTMVLGAKRR